MANAEAETGGDNSSFCTYATNYQCFCQYFNFCTQATNYRYVWSLATHCRKSNSESWQYSCKNKRDVEQYDRNLKAQRTVSAPPVLQSRDEPSEPSPSAAPSWGRPMVVSVERSKSLRAFTSAYGPNVVLKVLPINMIPLTNSNCF